MKTISLMLVIAAMALLEVEAQIETTIPTFECISIYWSPGGGSADKDVLVKFRQTGTTEWKTGLNMKYNPQNPDFDGGDYRGSIVNLSPDSEYEIELTLEGTDTKTTYTEVTWTENFPIGDTINPGNRSAQLTIYDSGNSNGYILYDGQGDTIDVDNNDDACIHIKASYVIIRNYVLTGGKKYGILLEDDIHDVIIEGCDISNWGEIMSDGFGTQQGAIQSTPYNTFGCGEFKTDISRIVVQRNKIHHPRSDANSWAEARGGNYHPIGPQAVMFLNSAGNHVIRYNEIWSDADHYYNDIIGYGCNQDWTGFPGPDTDIYGNYLANCWDEPIEVEGGGRNIRVWGNYMEECFAGIAAAGTRVGPVYAWNNVSGRFYSPPGSEYGEYAMFFKQEYDEDGYKYLFNNTILQPNGEGAGGIQTTYDSNERLVNIITRNNILHVREVTTRSISMGGGSGNNDFDYDLCNKLHPEEPNGLDGTPNYAAGTGFNREMMTGDYSLDPSSPGYDAGAIVPNFRDEYLGAAPDMGASEAGGPLFEYGVNAYLCDEYVTLTSSADYGLISPSGGSYCKGSTIQMRVTSDLGYEFLSWGGDLSGSDNPTTIVMDAAKNVTATFKVVPTYTLTVTTDGNGTVSLLPEGGVYNEGTAVVLTPVPVAGFEFDSWDGDLSGSEDPDTISMDADKNVTASFRELPVFTLSISTSGEGSVSLSPAGGSYDKGTVVTLNALPGAGYILSGWGGDLSGSDNPATLTMDDNKTVTATFMENKSLLAYWPMDETSGEILVDAGGLDQDVTLNHSDGTTFVEGKVNGGVFFNGSRDGQISSAPLLQPKSVTVAAYIKVDPSNADWAWVAALGDSYGLYVNGDGQLQFYFYDGGEWPDAVGSRNIRDNEWYHVAGTFDNATKKVKVYVDGVLDKQSSASGSINYNLGSDFHVGSMQNERHFLGVIDELRVFEMALSQEQIAALMVSGTQFVLTINAENGTISASPAGGTYNEGTVVTLTAVPDNEYIFESWSGDLTGSENPAGITMDADKTVSATFSPVTSVDELNVNSVSLEVYPNPFTNSVFVSYTIHEQTAVQLSVYDSYGKLVKVLVKQDQQPGTYRAEWNGTGMPAGVYICRLQSGNQTRHIRMLFIK